MKVLWWHTDKAEQWIRNNVCFEDWQLLGNGVAVDHHFISDITDGMVDDGFTLGVDFTIS